MREDDDLEATALWASRDRAKLMVLCPPRRHPLAAVFELPKRGEVLCVPGFNQLRRSLLATASGALDRPNELVRLRAALVRIAEYAPGELELGRCRCGTWNFEPEALSRREFGRTRAGRPYTLANYVATAGES